EAQDQDVQSSDGPPCGRVRRSRGTVGNDAGGRERMERARMGLRLYGGNRRRGRNEICMARSGAEIQAGRADDAERRALEKVDWPVQREDAVEGGVPGSVYVRLRPARGVCNREGWQDVLCVLCGAGQAV